MAAISLQQVRKFYDNGFHAVRDFSLDIGDGEFVVFVGPSGCGKSTTLRMIAGLEDISDGTLRIGGTVVNDLQPKERDIAMVFQSYALYPHMTVRQNMGFALKLDGVPKAAVAQRVDEAARMLQLDHLLERRPKELSGGQRQRVALGRAIVRKPQAFLMDEPLSNLDAKLRVEMRASILKLHRQLGVTTVYVTHDQVEAMTMGDRIVVMKGGEIQQVASPMELYERPVNVFVGGFIGSPAMSFLDGELRDGCVVGDGYALRLPAAMADRVAAGLAMNGGRAVKLGLRPEILSLDRAAGEPLAAVVDVVEPLGAETIVTLRVGGGTVVARLGGHARLEPEQALTLYLDTARTHVFDAATEANIGLGQREAA
ncbi:ABC transporter ATP-binding protein [Pseudoduganella albidiflava]|uniref:Glycerol-3-phosphate ABC transporter ATP-binding protein n=1 Tax=Pseudoduganella albidiflava TaxID=321983 RepID=A0A411X062_9BURK|nr:sn-glycerol-3-phosphate ABC transporter ATP-binding protein UgpC [Pseudoduganella albidiflava]QBI02340.1 sn-glycerol-3-phosphate ABC transporter ATP-binding protein UgpC [Pseudoduganella albidiflava]GGY43566.1 glycerol-3-phosphate ABC transporter ATP-binding protein [Pseudoduganella albidiflava]